MVTHQGCPQTPGGRIRALGFARMGARGRRRGPRTGDVSVSGLAGIIEAPFFAKYRNDLRTYPLIVKERKNRLPPLIRLS
jgi:hypothetical protein